MYKNAKKGWYKLVNPQKFIKPVDSHMQSFNEAAGTIEYKSSLELIAFKYADFNKHVTRFSVEPFNVKYIKPTDGKQHRYFIDMYIEFSNGEKFIVEVKSYGETIPPRKPSKKTKKSLANYQKSLETFHINQAKWKAATKFAQMNGMKFIILTEKQLK